MFIDGPVRLHALEWNPSGNVPVVLLHGWLDHAHSLAPLCEALPPHLRCLALDFRGHGQSAHAPSGAGYEVKDWLADLHALLRAEGLERVHLVGHSLGALVALAFAAAAPARVASVTAVDNAGPTLGPPARTVERLRAFISDLDKVPRRAVHPDVGAAEERLAARSPGMPRAVVQHLVRHGVEAVDGGVAFRFDPALRRSFAFAWDEAQAEALARAVEAPVQLIAGTGGHFQGKEAELELRRTWLRAGPPLWLPGGHHLHLERPGEVARAVAAWVERHR